MPRVVGLPHPQMGRGGVCLRQAEAGARKPMKPASPSIAENISAVFQVPKIHSHSRRKCR